MPDKLPFAIKVAYAPPQGATGQLDPTLRANQRDVPIGSNTVWGEVSVTLAVGLGGREMSTMTSQVHPGEAASRNAVVRGEIGLPFDVLADVVLELKAILYRRNIPMDSFFTEIQPGMPELTIRSTVISDNYGAEGMRVTSTVSGTTALEFSQDYLSLQGIGPLDYEEFTIELQSPCTVSTSTQIAAFYSIHGGQVGRHRNEMDESRGGLVIGDWAPGTGQIIATRTYRRSGPAGPATISEETTLELRWRD